MSTKCRSATVSPEIDNARGEERAVLVVWSPLTRFSLSRAHTHPGLVDRTRGIGALLPESLAFTRLNTLNRQVSGSGLVVRALGCHGRHGPWLPGHPWTAASPGGYREIT